MLIVSVLSFTRRLQRLYEATWEFETRGFRGTGGFLGLVFSLAGVTLGLLTPYLLLGRRLQWRRLIRQAALTAFGLTALAIWSVIYMPAAIESSAAAYGAIGVAFALLTWLWGLGIVLVAAAVYGSPQISWPPGSPRAGDGTVHSGG